MSDVTVEHARAWLQAFVNRHKLILEDEGEVGFGRECVGISTGLQYPGYLDIPEFRPYPEAPDAYHKSDCFAVLGRGAGALVQLYKWLAKADAHGIKFVKLERAPAKHAVELILHGTHDTVAAPLDYEGGAS